ncbi:sulfite exporter TauE/SafE family protein [Tetragenococcus halophilus]|uniref:sulfite exporter TauE/SafE family protein n=1 Tax=Tetragenococcus halophilus TaxID=51669 RepID=UPI0015C0944D|nr:sulfite exporter TauE/SafE family protein [Tetragenococcus halophilus]NWN99647.1 sulfite exporter TauE/SafE family protein [Tetragenococcus halophilus]
MIGLIYFAVIVLANTVGSVSGIGGGVIIKPILDFIGFHTVTEISFYSTVAVFTMAITSTIRQVKARNNFNWKIIWWVCMGSVLGGILGNVVYEGFFKLFNDETTIQFIQIGVTVVSLLFAFLYTRFRFPALVLTTNFWYFSCGIFLGALASFLGIGGGPINVALLMFMFKLPIKKAALYSICIILFSQAAKLLAIFFSTGFSPYDLQMLLFIIPAAAIGGLLGTKVSHRISTQNVTGIFELVILIVLAINVYNGYQLL